MLIDLDESRLKKLPRWIYGERIARGVYMIGSNPQEEFAKIGYTLQEYPFQHWDITKPIWDEIEAAMDAGYPAKADDARAELMAVFNGPADYGVADNWEQIVDKWPILEQSERQFIIDIGVVRREDQSPQGDWRWHKWGEYIGIQNPQHEYLYDEKDIDEVIIFQIYEVL